MLFTRKSRDAGACTPFQERVTFPGHTGGHQSHAATLCVTQPHCVGPSTKRRPGNQPMAPRPETISLALPTTPPLLGCCLSPNPFLSTLSVNQCHSCSQKINKQWSGEPLKAHNTFPNRKGQTPHGWDQSQAGARVAVALSQVNERRRVSERSRLRGLAWPG